VNIWGKPAENFAKLANRGQEIFVEASLVEVLESLVAHRLIDLVCQLRQQLNWMGSLAIIWVLLWADRACQPHLCATRRSGVSGAINDLDPTDLGPTLKHVSDIT
jgi:hypothetical protein